MSDIKYLGDGSPVLVIGDAPVQNTTTDGGATLTQVPHTYVARLSVEAVDSDQLHDSPEAAAEAMAAPAASEAEAVPARGDAQNADELQAKIDALAAENEALKANQAATANPPAA